jgi:uncharacterized cupredoxin-like copper-binding protein
MATQIPRQVAISVAALVVVACGVSAGPSSIAEPTATPTPPAPSVSIPPGAVVIELFVPEKKTSEFQLDGKLAKAITVKAGVPYVFRVNNPGYWDHNFYIGVAEDLAARQYERLVGTELWYQGVRDVVYTFQAGGPRLQFACTLAGHYGNMHGDFVVEE